MKGQASHRKVKNLRKKNRLGRDRLAREKINWLGKG
jgi:hypothetical protein